MGVSGGCWSNIVFIPNLGYALEFKGMWIQVVGNVPIGW